MRTLLCFVLAMVLSATLLAQGGGGSGGGTAATLSIGDRVAVPGSVIRVKMKIETSVPIRGIDLLLVYTSDTLAARSWFWVNWWEFGGWLVAQNARPDSDHIAMASRYPFVGSAVLGSFRERLASYVAPGTVVRSPLFVAILITSSRDTIAPILVIGSVIAGPRVKFGDVDQNGTLTVGDVVRALDIAIPDSGTTLSQVEFLAADVSGDGEIDTYDCWQILYKVVFPEYRFDVEDWEKSSIGIGQAVGSSPLVIEETNDGVVVKISQWGNVHNSDFSVVTKKPVSLELREGLAATLHKETKGANGDYQVGFVKMESLAENAPLLFLPGVRADEVEVRGTVNEGIPFVAGRVERTTSVDLSDAVPEHFSLAQNYPNPFNPATSIAFTLPTASHVTLAVYNVLGEEVARVVEGERAAGTHTVQFDASAFPSGMYVYRLQANGTMLSKKMLLTK